MNFFAIFHPLFILSYAILCITSFYIFKIYYLESESVSPLISLLCISSFFVSVWRFPTNLGESMLAFAGYIAIACLPSSFLVLVISKIMAETLVGAKDFMRLGKRDPIEELEEQVEALVAAGKFQDAISLIRGKMKKNQKDYRLNNEIATLSLMYLKDYKTALSEFEQVVKKTDKEEPVSFALYRMVDIYLTFMDEREKALECLKRIIKQFPNSEYAKNAKIRMEFMDQDTHEEEAPEIDLYAPRGDWRKGGLAEEEDLHGPFDLPEGSDERGVFDLPEKVIDEPGTFSAPSADWRQGFLEDAPQDPGDHHTMLEEPQELQEPQEPKKPEKPRQQGLLKSRKPVEKKKAAQSAYDADDDF
jgi:tetratricopeptide (TPR) repeat protein